MLKVEILKRQDNFQEIPNDFHRAITASEVISGIESSLRKIILASNPVDVAVIGNKMASKSDYIYP